ncbi:hypothetical protein MASR1M31_23120 [Porphyromonadaceae bacterium]
MIRVENISKHYSSTCALNKVSFEVKRGEMFGLIGPDGAGKTSLFRILTTLIDADRQPGSGAYIAEYNNETRQWLNVVDDYKKIRASVGYMPGRFSLYQDLTVEENLTFFATLFGTTIEENYHLVRDIYSQIEPFKARRAGKLSGGMKQKLALSCALIHKPTVLFLDEPTTGVDPVSRKEFWQMLARLKEDGLTIVVSTPYMDEALQCDRIALMNRGEIIEIDTPQRISEKYPNKLYAVSGSRMYELLKALREEHDIISAYAFGDNHHITVTDSFDPLQLRSALSEKGFTELKIEQINASIEDYFILINQQHD